MPVRKKTKGIVIVRGGRPGKDWSSIHWAAAKPYGILISTSHPHGSVQFQINKGTKKNRPKLKKVGKTKKGFLVARRSTWLGARTKARWWTTSMRNPLTTRGTPKRKLTYWVVTGDDLHRYW